jgi:GNAT superfamily N-acetyltransferase
LGRVKIKRMGGVDIRPADVDIRPVREEELGSVAGLRWEWILENEGTPVISRDEFVHLFVSWAQEHASSHHCTVAVRGGVIIGMAWLAILPRVPSPRAPARASGDMQCVYVVPDERNTGLGRQIIEMVLKLADELGLERVTVHSSPRAITAYSRYGFAASSRLLQAEAPFHVHWGIR